MREKMTKERAAKIRDTYLEEVKKNENFELDEVELAKVEEYLKDTLHLYMLPLLLADKIKDAVVGEHEFIGIGRVTHNRNNPNTYLSLVDCESGEFKKSLFSTRDLSTISEDVYYSNTKPRLADQTSYVLVKYQIKAREWLGNTGSGAAKEWTKDLPIFINIENNPIIEQYTSAEWNDLVGKKQDTINDALFRQDDQPSDLRSQSAVIQYVRDFLSDQRYDYREDVISQFIRALFTDQIILLSGSMGIGKTSLPREVAKVIGAECRMIQVKPNWTDEEDLLGYYDIEHNRYIPTPFIEALYEAVQDTKHIYFICLDEMNQSPVEDYFSSVLHALEGDRKLRLYSKFFKEPDPNFPPVFTIPSNVQLIGTMSMEAAAERPDRKILDRSYVVDIIKESDAEEAAVSEPPTDIEREITKLNVIVDDINKNLIKKWKEIKPVPADFNSADISISVTFSKRGEERARLMLEKGCSADDILAGRILPTLKCRTKSEEELAVVYEALRELCGAMGCPLSKAKVERMYDGQQLDYWKL